MAAQRVTRREPAKQMRSTELPDRIRGRSSRFDQRWFDALERTAAICVAAVKPNDPTALTAPACQGALPSAAVKASEDEVVRTKLRRANDHTKVSRTIAVDVR